MTMLNIPGVDFPLTASDAAQWAVDAPGGSVSVTAAPHSDIFIDPREGEAARAKTRLNAATLLGTPPRGDFQLSARVEVDFSSTFDAGVLLVWIDEGHWAKLCFEYSPDDEPMIVTVVSRGVADDANADLVNGNSTWLRVSRIDNIYAFHASHDGTRWRMVRAFALDDPAAVAKVGFEAQSPTGEGCDVAFSEISFTRETLRDLRDGT